MTLRSGLAVLLLLAPLLAAADSAQRAQVLDTPHYTVTITVRCPEGEVECADVRYRGVNRRTGQALVLKGRTQHQRCADGASPCRFLGWSFRNGSVSYFVGEGGELRVTRGDRVLVQESGAWRP